MLNKERWDIITRRITSPQSWIDFGFYFLISAALQRRVFYYGAGEDGSELFVNQYYCFVGKPGLGKGLVTGLVANLLRHHRYEKGELIKTSSGTERPPMFPVGADSITFEELLADIADNVRRVPRPDRSIYVHASYAFILEELSSLFKKKTQDVVNFLISAYDGKPYDYKTKHQGKQLLRNLCMSFLAGTQPDFFMEARKSGIFGSGFASRTLFLFENKKRFSAFHVTQLDEEQQKCKAELLEYIKKLATLYGAIKYTEDTYNFLESWERDVLTIQENTCSARMAEYVARKKVMMLKLAAAMHFGESTAMEIPQETFMKAMKLLDSIEPQMELGLTSSGRNELHGYMKKILDFITFKETTAERDVILTFAADMNVMEIRQCLDTLEAMGQIKSRLEKTVKLYTIK